MGHLVTVAATQLNQWALDWEGNTRRIIESCRLAKEQGATLRTGPELEVTGYGCYDHFLESDIYLHSWECLAEILKHPHCQGLLFDIGMPIVHRNVRYNARVVCQDGQISLIRPKLYLANDGNYREMRYFTPWLRRHHVEQYYLPRMIRNLTERTTVPIGDAVISTPDTTFGVETCEELFTPRAPHVDMALNGVEIMSNSSGSHWEIRKLDTRISLILEATRKSGGIYLYSNQLGCDGDRLYYDGCALVIINGNIVAQGAQFSLREVEVVTATVDLEEVRSYRSAPSRGLQAVQAPSYERIEIDFSLSAETVDIDPSIFPSPPLKPRIHTPEEEISLGPACFLWQYLCRTGAAGYMLALSGGIDSCATATIVFSMCNEVIKAIEENDEHVIRDCRRICAEDSDWLPASAEEICGKIFCSAYMGSKKSSSAETRSRARELSRVFGGYHIDINIDTVVEALTTLFTYATNFTPRFRVYGGSTAENFALQNIQARIRMVIIYFFAQLMPTVRKRPGGGGLLVLGSANVDECLRGYLTKYDCSSADINPIGGISKTDLKSFIGWSREHFDKPILQDFLDAIPTAELEPLEGSYVQSDEHDMGMTYEELSIFGKLRKVEKLGPYSMFMRLTHVWKHLSPRLVYEKVRRFHYFFNINRHKMTVITPAVHAEAYSPEDNRYDLRPFVYPKFEWVWSKIEKVVGRYEATSDGNKGDLVEQENKKEA